MKNKILKISLLVVFLLALTVPLFLTCFADASDILNSNSYFYSSWYDYLSQNRFYMDSYYDLLGGQIDSFLPFSYDVMIGGNLYGDFVSDPLWVNYQGASFEYLYSARFSIYVDGNEWIYADDGIIRVSFREENNIEYIDVIFALDYTGASFRVTYTSVDGFDYMYYIYNVYCYTDVNESVIGDVYSTDIRVGILTSSLDNIGSLSSLMFGSQPSVYPKAFKDGFDYAFNVNADAIYDSGYKDGYKDGYVEGEKQSIASTDAYKKGYDDATADIKSGDFGRNFLGSMFSAPFTFLDSVVLVKWVTDSGVTIVITLLQVVSAAFGLCLFVWFLKMFAGG